MQQKQKQMAGNIEMRVRETRVISHNENPFAENTGGLK